MQDFLDNKALTFEQHLGPRTYLYFDNETKEIAAYYIIAISVFLGMFMGIIGVAIITFVPALYRKFSFLF